MYQAGWCTSKALIFVQEVSASTFFCFLLLRVRNQVSHPYKTKDKTIHFYTLNLCFQIEDLR